MRIAATPPGPISAISVSGFKSLAERSTVELRPLTLLAGANSSGKSSIMQPALLLKQTLEASYDPGPLLLSDSHVRFTSADQLLSRVGASRRAREFSVEVIVRSAVGVESTFREIEGKHGLDLACTIHRLGERSYRLTPRMGSTELRRIVADLFEDTENGYRGNGGDWEVRRRRCFLEIETGEFLSLDWEDIDTVSEVATALEGILHVPGHRGNPTRTYKTSAVGRSFPGTFENYVASIVSWWQDKDDEKLDLLGGALRSLGLTWKVRARPVDATQVELQVGRLTGGKRGQPRDLVNIADVGFGVSQVLPVVVALLTARSGQLVYLEQPEIHLHPRAEVALARLLCDAANRGVRVVAETHSPLVLTAIQTQVAEGHLKPELVKLHWFRRRDDGVTEIASADLDANGAFGPWPEDFAEVTLKTEGAYLDAVEGVSTR